MSWQGRYEPDSDVLYKIKVNCSELLKQSIASKECNCAGFRDYKEFSQEKTKFRVALVGDSFSESPGLASKNDSYYFILEQKLKEVFQTENIEVYNFGMGGYSTEQEYYLIKNKALDYHPDLIILQYFSNDNVEMRKVFESKFLIPSNSKIGSYLKFPVPISISLGEKADTFLISNFESYRRILFSIESIRLKLKYTRSQDMDVNKIKLIGYMDKIASLAQSNNIPVVLILFPGAFPYDEACSEEPLANVWDFIGQNPELQKKFSLIINPCSLQKEYDWETLRMKIDADFNSHYNKLGNEIMVNATVDSISGSDLFGFIKNRLAGND